MSSCTELRNGRRTRQARGETGNAMQIELKLSGGSLHDTLDREINSLNEALFKLSKQSDPVQVALTPLDDPLQACDMLLNTDAPSLLLVEAPDMHTIDRMQGMEKRELLMVDNPLCRPLVLAPVIAVFPAHEVLREVRDFPELISDWMFLPLNIGELARRIIVSLKRKSILKTRLCYGALTLLPESRLISYANKSVHLTRSEFALAELFLSQIGAVIPMSDLVLLFKSTGKSTEGSNIRVTVFQLRLKLEMLTKSQYTLISVYKRGYCLKQKSRTIAVESGCEGVTGGNQVDRMLMEQE